MKSELEQLKERLLQNKEYRKELFSQDLPFEIAEAVIDARVAAGITQRQLADKIGTKQSAIARLESGRGYPNLKTLEKIATTLGLRMKNPLEPINADIDNCYFRVPVAQSENGICVQQGSIRINNLNFIS
jgi:transcriptional regulator with XRE-family HTH domain